MDEDKKVSINAASIEQLETLDGIGKKKAQAIIDYRNKYGKFKSIEDLKKVKGIGNITFAKNKDGITLLSKRQLLNKKIKTKVEKSKNVVAHKTLDGVKKIKEKLSLLGLNIKKGIYAGEVAILNKASQVKSKITGFIDKAKLKGKNIKTKISSGIGKVKTVTKETLYNLKKKISSSKLGLGIKQVAGNIKVAGLKVENATLKGINTVKEKATNLRYKIEDKLLLAKYKIKTKIERKKNLIARKTGMQIALFKNDLKKKLNNAKKAMQVDSAKLQATRDKIAALKATRSKLVNDLFPPKVDGKPATAR